MCFRLSWVFVFVVHVRWTLSAALLGLVLGAGCGVGDGTPGDANVRPEANDATAPNANDAAQNDAAQNDATVDASQEDAATTPMVDAAIRIDAAPADATIDTADASSDAAGTDAPTTIDSGTDATQTDANTCDPLICDPDQCSLGFHNCHVHATCTDLDPGFRCDCNDGFVGDGTTCTDVDECALGTDSCDRSPYACVNTSGTFACLCPTGYEGNGIASVGCSDVDECSRGTHNCPLPSDCANTIGSFHCGCEDGYQKQGEACVDIDECTANTDNCSDEATCNNADGSFTCACFSGFVGNGLVCTDIDECDLNLDNCNSNATCNNTVGAFTCTCNSGFSGSGVTCTDVNECTNGSVPCDTAPVASCTNSTGSFSCACPPGYTGNGVGPNGCVDVNECANGTHNCGTNYTCTNTGGSFMCSCGGGFVFTAGACVDVNECTSNTDGCDTSPDACVNTNGSFACACPGGYTGNGIGSSGCIDLNECTDGTHNCSANGYCSNTTGSFRCYCNSGYGGDGVTCLPFATLTNVEVGIGSLTPAFLSTRLWMTAGVPLGVSTLPITVTGQGTITVDGIAVTSGVAYALPLAADTRVYDITVSRPGYTTNTYQLTVVIGAPTYLKPFGTPSYAGQYFGTAVAVDGDTVVVGANGFVPGAGMTRGAVYVFVRSGGTWVTQAQILEPMPGNSHRFGTSVGISGDTMVVGADGSSYAHVFVRSGGNWTHQASLRGTGADANDFVGISVAIDGDTIAVGAHYEDGSSPGVDGPINDDLAKSGAAHVFTRSGTVWTQQAYIKASIPGQNDNFGTAVALSGDLLAVGAPYEDSSASGVNGSSTGYALPDSGAAYVFTRSAGTWSHQAYLKASDPTTNARFGTCVAADAGTVAVCGYVNVYVFTSTGGAWSQQARIQRPSAPAYAVPTALALVGNRLAFGITEWPYGGWGINDDYMGTSGGGAAFLYTRTGATWAQTWYVRPGYPASGSLFARRVGYDGTTLVVGAPWEASNATGVNGNMFDSSKQYEGAAYVYF